MRYKIISKKVHPDKNPNSAISKEVFQIVSAANVRTK